MTHLTRDALEIFLDGEQVPGVIIYGLSQREIADRSTPAKGSMFDPHRTRYSRLHGEQWNVALWDVPVITWLTAPDTRRQVHVALDEVLRRGCSLAWLGAEGLLFADPPHLFDPAYMSGGVLAWLTADGNFGCLLDPDRPLDPASDDDLRMLRAIAQSTIAGDIE